MSRKLSRWMRPVAASVVPALLGILGCGKDPLVGGTCRVGLTECSLKCTDTNEDLSNCGSCGHVCGNNLICFGGICADEGLLGLRDARGDAPAKAADGGIIRRAHRRQRAGRGWRVGRRRRARGGRRLVG